jgi:hypothetical protein
MLKKLNKVFLKFVISCLFIVGLICVVFSGCAMYDPGIFEDVKPGGEVRMKTSSESEITLAWSPTSSPVKLYRIYYRDHGAAFWNFLAEIPEAAEPQYTISINDIGPGTYDFGVSAVDIDDQESGLHTSLDVTADPSTGWFLSWTEEWYQNN